MLVQCKAAARSVVPPALYQRASTFYRRTLDLARHPVFATRFGFPELLIHFGMSPGDDLLCTAVLRELKTRGDKKIWMMSNNTELFTGNTDAAKVVPVDQRFRDYATLWGGTYQHLEYARFDPPLDRSQPPTRHVIAEMCSRAGVTGEIDIRPYIHLTSPEKDKSKWANGVIAVQSSGLAARLPMRNKEWFPERFQEAVNRLQNNFKFVQIGSRSDPLLRNALDLRGKTNIRETAAILSWARLFIGLEGFLMHLARAVDCPAVIVQGGRTAPWQTGYPCNIHLYSAVPCAPCWLWNTCEFDHKCMNAITPEMVVNAAQEQLNRDRSNLPLDRTRV